MIGAILMVCTFDFYMYLGAIATAPGGVVAAPIAKSCLESILPILNVEKSNSSIEYVYRYGLNANLITVDDYVGKKLKKERLLFCI